MYDNKALNRINRTNWSKWTKWYNVQEPDRNQTIRSNRVPNTIRLGLQAAIDISYKQS